MKQIIILGIVLAAIWWGWTQFKTDPPVTPQSVETSATGGQGAIKTISNGKKVNLTDHLVPGKFTVFMFYANW